MRTLPTRNKLLLSKASWLLLGLLILIACAPNTTPTPEVSRLASPTPRLPQTCTASVPSATANQSMLGVISYATAEGVFDAGGWPAQTHQLVAWDVNEISPRLIGFSPNGQWLAYVTYASFGGSSYDIHLLSATGESLTNKLDLTKIISSEVSLVALTEGHWINNEMLLLSIHDPEFYEQYRADKLAILNPFTDEWSRILDYLPQRELGSNVAISPALDRILYFYATTDPAWERELVLWDIDSKKALWRNGEMSLTSRFLSRGALIAAWSPDNTQLAFVGPEPMDENFEYDHDGVYIFDLDIQEPRLVTDFLSRYEAFTTKGLAWSLDGRYLAFVVEYYKRNLSGEISNQIYLYDLLTEQLVDLCPLLGDSINTTSHALIWSPDSRSIAYSTAYSAGENAGKPRSLILVDIYTGKMITLVENAGTLGGWSEVFQ